MVATPVGARAQGTGERTPPPVGGQGAQANVALRAWVGSLAGRFELVAVDGQPLTSYTYRESGWTIRYTSGIVMIKPDGTFEDVIHTQADRMVGDAAEGSGSTSFASGRVSILADSVMFLPTDGAGKYAMRWSVAGDTVRLEQQFGPRLLTYERRPPAPAVTTRPASPRRRAPGPGAPSAPAGGPDRLRDIVRWAAPDAEGYSDTYTVTLPPGLDSAVRVVLPTFRVRTRMEMMGGGYFDPARPQVGMSAVIMDLDGDGLPEAVLLGTLIDEDTLDVVIGVRQTIRGFEVRELLRVPAPLLPGDDGSPGVDTNVLTLERLTARGATPTTRVAKGFTWWVRYQDGDCKGEGWQWTVRAGRWVRTQSDCSYGE